jgi:hypothetical protein
VKPHEVGSADLDQWNVKPRDVKPRDVKPRDVKPRDVKPRDVKPREVVVAPSAWAFGSPAEAPVGARGQPRSS